MAARLGAAALTRATVGRATTKRWPRGAIACIGPAATRVAARTGDAGHLRLAARRALGPRDFRRPHARPATAGGAAEGGMGQFTPRLLRAAARSRRALRVQYQRRHDRRRRADGDRTPAPAAARLVSPHAPDVAAAHRAHPPRAADDRDDVLSSRIPQTSTASASCFHRGPASTRSACCSTPTFSAAAACGDRKRGSSAIAIAADRVG